jgi:hypothetical protein
MWGKNRHENLNLPIFPTPTQTFSIALVTVTAKSIMGLFRGKIFTCSENENDQMARGRKTLISACCYLHNYLTCKLHVITHHTTLLLYTLEGKI